MSFFENTRKPTGFGGKLMVLMMNVGHRAPPTVWSSSLPNAVRKTNR